MSNSSVAVDEKRDRKTRGPVVIAFLIFFAACGISVDFFVRQSQILVVDGDSALTFADVVNFATTGGARSGTTAVSPLAAPSPAAPSPAAPSLAAPLLSATSLTTSPFDPFAITDREPASAPEERVPSLGATDLEPKAETPEDLKISLDAVKWKGAPQLLPNPMYVSQISNKAAGEIRGGGWLVIDVANSRILEVELFKAAGGDSGRRVIEAKYPNGERAVNPNNAGFPIVRGIKDLHVGNFEVFENPPCLVRAMNVNEEEICEVVLRGAKFRYKFSPPVIPDGGGGQEFPEATVYLDTGHGNWKKIASFNESFQPLGDPNRDGVPDFYAESVTSVNESGHHVLLISQVPREDSDGPIEYRAYRAAFKGNR